MKREPVIAALFARLSALEGVVTAKRRIQSVADMNPSDCPALFLLPKGQRAKRTTGLPPVWTIDVLVYVYLMVAPGSDVVPDTQLNTILDAIETALEPLGGCENQTLGGLCDWARIEGDIETDVGALGDAALAVVPIRIQVTAK